MKYIWFFIFVTWGCNVENTTDLIVKSGTFFGMSYGYSHVQVELSDSGKTFVAYSQQKETFPEKKHTTATIDPNWLTIASLVKQLNWNDFEDTYGCPDCADQGGEWIEIQYQGNVKKVTYEYRKAPEKLKKLSEILNGIRESYYQEHLKLGN